MNCNDKNGIMNRHSIGAQFMMARSELKGKAISQNIK